MNLQYFSDLRLEEGFNFSHMILDEKAFIIFRGFKNFVLRSLSQLSPSCYIK